MWHSSKACSKIASKIQLFLPHTLSTHTKTKSKTCATVVKSATAIINTVNISEIYLSNNQKFRPAIPKSWERLYLLRHRTLKLIVRISGLYNRVYKMMKILPFQGFHSRIQSTSHLSVRLNTCVSKKWLRLRRICSKKQKMASHLLLAN